jgi:CubicO group peptidase (beta-lactamase class C family)
MNVLRATSLSMAILLASCGSGGDGDGGGLARNGRPPDINPGLPPMFTVSPENTGDGWSVSTPENEGIDANVLRITMDTISAGRFAGIDSMLVVRNGRLVSEGYFNGFGRESLHDLRSTGKSVTSALTGLAIQQGLIEGGDPISQHVPNFEAHDHVDARKRAITVFHLLNMNSGLDCDDADAASPGNEERMYDSRNWIDFILDLRMRNDPGTQAYYCTGGVVVLGGIISSRSGMALDDYAAAYLFAPLGIQNSAWRRSPDGRATGGGGLWLRPRDAAKFGELYLDGGTWNGARVLPTAWVEESQRRVTTLHGDGYGFLWWKRTFTHAGTSVECFYTSGNGGNFIFVVPALELVAVFTGSNYNSSAGRQPLQILADRIIPAVR